MRSRVLGAWLVLAVTAGWPPAPARAEDPVRAPRITVAPERFDFGAVLPGKEVSHEFVIRNLGSADLTLDKPQTSCGCTVASGYSPLVKPGGSTVLRVTLTTPPNSGRILKTVMVRSNDPARAVLELKVEATVTVPEKPAAPVS